MAELLWGQVYMDGFYAGMLRQEPGERCSFTYDVSYLSGGKAIAWTLPLQERAHISERGLHPFFDNLVAEGWLEEAQTRLLGKRVASRFELLLAFGRDCAGAVSVHDPSPAALDRLKMDLKDPKQVALLKGRASLSGVQPKFALVKEKGKFRPAAGVETSTHIAKFSSASHEDLIWNEYLTMQAIGTLLPGDSVAEVDVGAIEGFSEPVLIIKRFDRTMEGGRMHFEEFNQLLGRPSAGKYDGGYREMADFIRGTPGCIEADVYKLYLRILAGLLLGNTDMHFKNFALLYTPAGLRLSPSYDQVAAALYDYKTVALAIGGIADMAWGGLKARSLVRLGTEFGLSKAAMTMAFESLAARREKMFEAIAADKQGSEELKGNLLKLVKKRWNGTFSLIGRELSKKQ
jgi:serine/threonine-protein kinase HipA